MKKQYICTSTDTKFKYTKFDNVYVFVVGTFLI